MRRESRDGDQALKDILLAAWPERAPDGRGNLDRLLEASIAPGGNAPAIAR
jgi:hypothetical protein